MNTAEHVVPKAKVERPYLFMTHDAMGTSRRVRGNKRMEEVLPWD